MAKKAPREPAGSLPVINIDEDIRNADWTKTTWDLPYTSAEEMRAAMAPEQIEHFKTLPVFEHHLDQPGFEWLFEL